MERQEIQILLNMISEKVMEVGEITASTAFQNLADKYDKFRIRKEEEGINT